MTAQPGRAQAPFTAGELSPVLRERRDLKYYRNGALYMRNVEVLPQGGFRYAGGSLLLSRVRLQLAAVALGGASVSAPCGGVAANAIDSNPASVFTTSAIAAGSGSFVVLQIQFGALTRISAVDVEGYFASAGSGVLVAQYWTGLTWINIATPRNMTTQPRSRRFAFPPNVSLQCWGVRVVVLTLAAAATVTLGNVAAWVEGDSWGATRLRPFMDRDGGETVHCLTDLTCDVVSNHWLDAYRTAWPAARLPALKTIQQLDTMVGFHADIAPQRVVRQGADTEWQAGAAPLVNIPTYDFGNVYYNGVAAVWEVSLIGAPSDSTIASVKWIVTVNGEDTAALTCPATGGLGPPDWTAFAAIIAAAIEALPNVSPGIAVSHATDGSKQIYDITFSGKGNEGDGWLVSMRATNESAIAAPAWRKTRGVAPGEAAMSDARGWPRCGVFYQQSLIMGGLRSLPNVWLKSESGNYWNFQTDTVSPTGAMMVPMDTQGGEAIEEMVAGRTLMVMTSLAEYFLADRALSKSSAPNHVEASRHGAIAGVPTAENEGAAVFVQQSGGVLYEFRYDDVAQTFKTANLSILASHLLSGVSDLAVRRATAFNDANLLYAVTADGGLRSFALLREQDVTAATRRDTNGDNPEDRFLSACVLPGSNAIAVITSRRVAGGEQRYIERLDPDGLLDQATTFYFDNPSQSVGGLWDYRGQVVWAIADRDVLGPFTVPDSAAIDLGQRALKVTIGRWTPPRVETLPPDRSIGPGVVLERRARIHTARIALQNTTSIAVGANGGRVYDINLLRFGARLNVGALDAPFTGVIKVQGLTGFADQPTLVITQKRPGTLHVRGVEIEADL